MGVEEVIKVIRSDELKSDSPDWSNSLILAIKKKNDELFSLILQKYLEGKASVNLDAPVQNGLNFLAYSIMLNHFDYFQMKYNFIIEQFVFLFVQKKTSKKRKKRK